MTTRELIVQLTATVDAQPKLLDSPVWLEIRGRNGGGIWTDEIEHVMIGLVEDSTDAILKIRGRVDVDLE